MFPVRRALGWGIVTASCLALAACAAGGGFGGDWIYNQSSDPITRKPSTLAMLMLYSSDFTNEPSYLAATCDENGFEFFIASEGFWGQYSTFFRRNQTFEMRVGDTVFSGRYLASNSGDSAYLISGKPKFKAVVASDLLAAFNGARSVAVRVSDYRGVSSTTSRSISGNAEGLLRVAADCGVR